MQPSVLVVDDDPSTRSGLAELLASAGYRVLTADSYEAGRAVLRNEPPDLLVVDVRLGIFNGLQLLLSAPQSAAVVITGHDDAHLEDEARRLGADYFIKPITPTILLEALDRRIKRR